MKIKILAPILLVVMIAGGGVWYFLDGDDEPVIQQDSAGRFLVTDPTKSTAPCSGEWFDTHVHLESTGFSDRLVPLMNTFKVGCAIAFVEMRSSDIADSVEMLQENIGPYPGRFVPFYYPSSQTATDVARANLEPAVIKTDIAFRGMGEFGLYRPQYANDTLDAPHWTGVFELAQEKNLIPMLHPRRDQQAQMDALAKKYPDVTFLIHGFDFGGAGVVALLKDNTNILFTLDTATLLTSASGGPMQYPNGQGSADAFVADFDRENKNALERAVTEWAQVVTAAPDRVMWGTDIAMDWHPSDDVYRRLMEFSEAFVARLPEEVRADFKGGNAKRLFGNAAVAIKPVAD